MTNRKTVEVWVGIFVAAGVFALGVLAFRVGNLTTTDVENGYRVEARFENVGTLAGVRVGRVAAIRSDPDTYQAVVVLNIDGRYKNLPADTSASILTSGLLGEQYIELEPGGAEEHLKEGSRIKLTQSAMVLEKLVGRLLTSFIDKPADNKK
ncbi:MAG: transporter substrate-binding protein [Proteobacteria bacterium]|nr:transporter substrate-binding protein [Pseudomonadota bacterium]